MRVSEVVAEPAFLGYIVNGCRKSLCIRGSRVESAQRRDRAQIAACSLSSTSCALHPSFSFCSSNHQHLLGISYFINMSLFDSIKDWTYTFIIGVCVASYW